MRLRLPIRCTAALLMAMCAAASLQAQQLIGYVNTHDAEVSGASDVLNGRAVLTGSAAVTARDRTAPITLGRGGTVLVCQTSALHVTENKSASAAAPLLFSLDRGAIEIQTAGTVNDSIMTPDLRFSVANAGPLDLRLRVARNGDTCVENRGAAAPTLNISDPFGETMYQVSAGQHVLFEHGDLHQVVDHEREPCGCPDPQGMALADALLAAGGAPEKVEPPAAPIAAPATQQATLQTAEQIAAAKAAQAHPFPAAVSEGLAPPAEIPQSTPGVTHMQITDTLSYSAADAFTPANAAPAPAAKQTGTTSSAQTAAAPAPPLRHDPLHVVGRFFKRFFGG
jgi:hypothetical protein